MTSTAATLFGTDGIRGTANRFPMTPELVLRVGQAIGHLMRRRESLVGGAAQVGGLTSSA
ncbi:MAG: hypothetical protein C5B49_07630, partial [Bdellovibrio sp.]